MFDVKYNRYGVPFLKWVDRPRKPFERGLWVEIGHEEHKHIEELVESNKKMGLTVLKDEKGFFRALVLKD